MADEVLLAKAANIERCLARIEQEYRGHEEELESNFTRQDAIVLNLLRACEAAIDMAMRACRVRRLGVPRDSREAFALLRDAGLLEPSLADRLMAMVGFHNIAIHAYTALELPIVRAILDTRLEDFRVLIRSLLPVVG
ncbi:MAG: DUF86 domain-containing protein [Myxococcaceae bacterium]|nr:DUF86 domain-containing protein [Myxococcaceae bacterium]